MRIVALLVLGLICVPSVGLAQSGPFSTPWDGRGFVEIGGGGQGGSHLLTETSRFAIYDEEATVNLSQSYGGGPFLNVGGGVKVWQNLLFGIAYTRFSNSVDTNIQARVPNPLVANRFRDAELRPSDLRHKENTVHLSAIYMVPLNDDFTIALSIGPSFASVSHEFARDVRVAEVSGPPAFDTVAISDPAFIRSSKTKATINVGANLDYDLPFRMGDTGRVGAVVGFRYAAGSVSLAGASGPVDVKFGGPQITGGVRVTF